MRGVRYCLMKLALQTKALQKPSVYLDSVHGDRVNICTFTLFCQLLSTLLHVRNFKLFFIFYYFLSYIWEYGICAKQYISTINRLCLVSVYIRPHRHDKMLQIRYNEKKKWEQSLEKATLYLHNLLSVLFASHPYTVSEPDTHIFLQEFKCSMCLIFTAMWSRILEQKDLTVHQDRNQMTNKM